MKRKTVTQNPSPSKTRTPLSTEETTALFEKELRKRYWAEKELAGILPKFAKLATSYELTKAIENHISVTEKQINRLLHIFDILEERGSIQRYGTMQKLLAQSEETLLLGSGYARDKAIIAVSTSVMLHEIKSYQKLLVYAKYIKEEISAAYLSIAISEEKQAHDILNEIALSSLYFDEAG
jgi:ferritin-like metal-binding protein YciE